MSFPLSSSLESTNNSPIETVGLGEIKLSKWRQKTFIVPSLGTAVVVTVFDSQLKVGGMAHVVLPESQLNNNPGEAELLQDGSLPAKYANLAIPGLLDAFEQLGGQRRTSVVRMVGGAQLFNFGGGGGNIINIGARNAIAIRAALSKMGLAIEKADTGGNKNKAVRFAIETGQVYVCPIGGKEYAL